MEKAPDEEIKRFECHCGATGVFVHFWLFAFPQGGSRLGEAREGSQWCHRCGKDQITTLDDSNILNFMSACKSFRLKHDSFNSWPITQFTGITAKVCLWFSAERLPSENAVGSLLNGYIQTPNHCVLFTLSSSLSQWPRRATSSASKSSLVNVTFILPRNVWLLTTHNYDAHSCNSDTRLINNQRTG